ncbi:MAG: tetratricopeptide repeat protein [Bacteroidales bacterium]|jgi:tetratricopeptide (TPR) repeat protein|nr:tetratricopeptide repeat protein [Bacteroidales bacterium]
MRTPLRYKAFLTGIVLTTAMVFTSCKSKQAVVANHAESADVLLPQASKFSQVEQMTIDNAFLEGVKLMTIEDFASAQNVLLDVLQMDNNHAPANYEMSKIKLMQNELDEAEIYAERASRLSPNNKYYLEHLAYIYRQSNNQPQALMCFQRLTKLDPRNDDYLYEAANTYLLLGKPLEAVKIYDTIERKHGILDEISMQKIKIYQTLGKDENVRQELANLIRNFPNETKYLLILAEMNMRANKYKEAYADYQKILALDPENAYIHLSLADYYKAQNDTAKVFEELALAFQNPQLDIDAKITLLLPLYRLSSQKENTYKLLDAVLSAHPADAKALSIYADFLQRDDRYAEARNKYREVIQQNVSKYLIWEALLFCDLNLMDTASLLNDAQQALEQFPEQPLVYYMLGIAYNLKADYDMAMQYLEQAIPLAQTNRRLLTQLYSDLGDIYHQLKNPEKSDLNYRKALEIEPENALVLNNFAYFLSVRKEQLDEAEKMARLVCQRNPNNPTYLDTFAWVLYQRGKYKEAKSIMELALKYSVSQEATLLEHYGDILWKFGDKDQALNFWKQAKGVDEAACSDVLNQKIETQNLIEN